MQSMCGSDKHFTTENLLTTLEVDLEKMDVKKIWCPADHNFDVMYTKYVHLKSYLPMWS